MTKKQRNLLLSKLVAKGHKIKDLAGFLGMTTTNVYMKFEGINRFTLKDIDKMRKMYDLSDEDVCAIFLS